ncbi:hypothetical protein BGW42_001350 [Actinomortierella wolfii]|nr:hypothetical protein BGW42_001350 [Actinomortierella wolfii]
MLRSWTTCINRLTPGALYAWPGSRQFFVQRNSPLPIPLHSKYIHAVRRAPVIGHCQRPRTFATEAKATEAALVQEEECLATIVAPQAREKLSEIANKAQQSTKAESTTLSSINAATIPTSPLETVLRPYQQEVIDICLSKFAEGVKRQIVSLPVGSGKTVIFSHLMKQVPPPFPGATKTLILAHRQELLEQTRKHVLSAGSGLTVTIDQGNRNADMNADVIVASVPTLGRSGTTKILKYDPRQFKCIIIDEAHHAAAESYRRILKHFGADHKDTHIFLYGCSATVRRHDGLQLRGIFDHVSFHKDFLSMIEDKWQVLCGLRVSTIKTDFDLRDVKTLGGDFVQKDLAFKVNTPIRNEIVVRSYMKYCQERHSTVVFAVDIAHLEALTELFRKYGYDARGLSSKTDPVTRAQLLHDFRNRKFPIIVNCGILTEGTDIPAIDSILMARPTKSNVLFQQMLGRGMRLYPGKEDCLVLDFVDIVRGNGLVTLPTLLGLDPDAVLQHEDDSLFPSTTEEVEDEEVDPMTGAKVLRIRVLEYENPYQLIDDCSGTAPSIWQMTPFSWVNVGANMFVLETTKILLRIERSEHDGLFRCYKRVKMISGDGTAKESGEPLMSNVKGNRKKKQFFSKGQYLPLETDTLQDCFHAVDTWISANIKSQVRFMRRNARWRKGPATSGQIAFLKKLGMDKQQKVLVERHEESGSGGYLPEERRIYTVPLEGDHLTRGQAANLITRLAHGAGKRWEKHRMMHDKKAKIKENDFGIQVGPIAPSPPDL